MTSSATSPAADPSSRSQGAAPERLHAVYRGEALVLILLPAPGPVRAAGSGGSLLEHPHLSGLLLALDPAAMEVLRQGHDLDATAAALRACGCAVVLTPAAALQWALRRG